MNVETQCLKIVEKVPKTEYLDMIITPENGFVNPYFSKIGKIFKKPLYKTEKACYNETVKEKARDYSHNYGG